MASYVDPSDLSPAMRTALLVVAGAPMPSGYRRDPLAEYTTGALERRGLITWDCGWKLTDRGRGAVAWFRQRAFAARRAKGGTSGA